MKCDVLRLRDLFTTKCQYLFKHSSYNMTWTDTLTLTHTLLSTGQHMLYTFSRILLTELPAVLIVYIYIIVYIHTVLCVIIFGDNIFNKSDLN